MKWVWVFFHNFNPWPWPQAFLHLVNNTRKKKVYLAEKKNSKNTDICWKLFFFSCPRDDYSLVCNWHVKKRGDEKRTVGIWKFSGVCCLFDKSPERSTCHVPQLRRTTKYTKVMLYSPDYICTTHEIEFNLIFIVVVFVGRTPNTMWMVMMMMTTSQFLPLLTDICACICNNFQFNVEHRHANKTSDLVRWQ